MKFVPTASVDLIVTSPPFLDKVDYLVDNWLEFWFAGIKARSFSANLVMARSLEEWSEFIRDVLREMLRVLKPGGYAVVEVGEVETGGEVVYLDEIVARAAGEISAPAKRLLVEEVLVNKQTFTKLANCFKVDNNQKGTNTNRLVVIKCSGRAPGVGGRRSRRS
jgi:methylase of polypeptide subunit release factors